MLKRAPALWGVLAAVALHGAAVATLGAVDTARWTRRPPPTVELDVLEPPPPPPPPEAPPPTPEPPPPPRPRVVHHVVAKPPPTPPPPSAPPTQEPPPDPPKDPPPPVFGLTLDSTVTGDSAVAVPVGNTLATASRKPAPPGPPPAPAAPGPPEFAPVPDSYLSSFPEKTREVKPDYPGEARRLGLDGQVTLRVGIDRHGVVRSVRLLKKAGYGMDEAAVQAMWKFKFTPARSKEGQPVDCQINYTHTFQAER